MKNKVFKYVVFVSIVLSGIIYSFQISVNELGILDIWQVIAKLIIGAAFYIFIWILFIKDKFTNFN